MTLKDLIYYSDVLGFDNSSLPNRAKKDGTRPLHIACSQCEALVINGIATHENGCPNRTAECAGCSNRVSWNQKYCSDCQ